MRECARGKEGVVIVKNCSEVGDLLTSWFAGEDLSYALLHLGCIFSTFVSDNCSMCTDGLTEKYHQWHGLHRGAMDMAVYRNS